MDLCAHVCNEGQSICIDLRVICTVSREVSVVCMCVCVYEGEYPYVTFAMSLSAVWRASSRAQSEVLLLLFFIARFTIARVCKRSVSIRPSTPLRTSRVQNNVAD